MADLLFPMERAPDAVVRRRGETREQSGMRREGYSDFQTGFNSGRGGSPLLRAASIAAQQQRMVDEQARFDLRNQLEQDKLRLNREKADMQERIQQQALSDKMTAIEQTKGFLSSIDAAAGKFGRGTPGFHASVLAESKNFPAAIHGDPRLGSLLRFHEESYQKLGGTPEQATALWEVGQARGAIAKLPPAERLAYLESLPGKYPGAFKSPSSPETMLFKSLYDEAKKGAAPAAVVPEGMVPKGMTVNAKGEASTTYEQDKPDKGVLTSLEKERAMHAKMLDRAKRIRSKATDEAVIADADADILESEKALSDVESQIRTHREGATPASTSAPERTATNPQTGEKLVFRGGKWTPL